MSHRDAIDDVIDAAAKTSGTMPLEPATEFQGIAWAGKVGPPRQQFGYTVPLLAILLLAICSLFVVLAYVRQPPPDPRLAFRSAAIELITRKLKTPATASFAPFEEWTFAAVNGSAWRMTGWVDAENVFSALLRQRFTVIISDSGTGQWQLKYLKFEGSDEAFGKYEWTPQELAAAKANQERDAEAARRARVAKQTAEAAATAQAAADSAAAFSRMRAQWDDGRQEASDMEAAAAAAEKLRRERAAESAEQERAGRQRRAAIEAAAYRTWTAVDGRLVAQGKIVSIAGDVVTIEGRDRTRSKIDAASLITEDRAFIEVWKRKRR